MRVQSNSVPVLAMSDIESVLIVGGGIAGMALAIVLQRAGIAAEIAEIDKDWRVYGPASPLPARPCARSTGLGSSMRW
jgi:2-polyprenyl-6-methoxyphenol hydroxylase-like FAD-dependent oxidoreductase